MKRDMELIRAILRHVQEREGFEHKVVRIAGYDDLTVDRHVELLAQAGYIDGPKRDAVDMLVPQYFVQDLTWEGHDLASALGNETIWAQVKKAVSPQVLATAPLAIVKEVGVGLLSSLIRSSLGLPDH